MSEIDIQLLEWTRAKPLAQPIRIKVFIQEQHVPESEEWDRWDDFSVHAVAIIDGVAVGTARLTRDCKIGRMAVLKDYRQQGIGGAMLKQLIDEAKDRGMQQLSLSAQTHAQHFYARHGFTALGEEFSEVDIPHITMQLALKD